MLSRPENTAAVMAALGLAAGADEMAVRADAVGWCTRLGFEMQQGRHGAREADLGLFAEEAFAIKRLIDNNPRVLGLGNIEGIYRAAFKEQHEDATGRPPPQDGPSALQLLNSDLQIDLLLSDVGLPGGMNGRQLADAARRHG